MNTGFKITIHMATSLDGMIAKKDNSITWFDTPDVYEKGAPAPDAFKFLQTIDCYVMGARTYEHAIELSGTFGWAYGDTRTIVLTHQPLPIERPNIELYSGGLGELINNHLRPACSNIWVAGGPSTAKDFIRAKLADEVRLSVLPIILGDGLPFFDHIGQEQPLHLLDVTAFKSGVVELVYEIRH